MSPIQSPAQPSSARKRSASTSPTSEPKPRKQRRRGPAGKQDHRDFVPPGAAFSSSGVSLANDGPVSLESGEITESGAPSDDGMLKIPESVTKALKEMDELLADPHRSAISQPVSPLISESHTPSGQAPSVKWNAGTRSKIRTTLGKRKSSVISSITTKDDGRSQQLVRSSSSEKAPPSHQAQDDSVRRMSDGANENQASQETNSSKESLRFSHILIQPPRNRDQNLTNSKDPSSAAASKVVADRTSRLPDATQRSSPRQSLKGSGFAPNSKANTSTSSSGTRKGAPVPQADPTAIAQDIPGAELPLDLSKSTILLRDVPDVMFGHLPERERRAEEAKALYMSAVRTELSDTGKRRRMRMHMHEGLRSDVHLMVIQVAFDGLLETYDTIRCIVGRYTTAEKASAAVAALRTSSLRVPGQKINADIGLLSQLRESTAHQKRKRGDQEKKAIERRSRGEKRKDKREETVGKEASPVHASLDDGVTSDPVKEGDGEVDSASEYEPTLNSGSDSELPTYELRGRTIAAEVDEGSHESDLDDALLVHYSQSRPTNGAVGQGTRVNEPNSQLEGNRLQVGNLDVGMTETDLKDFFGGYELTSAAIPGYPFTTHPGHGLVIFASSSEARRALADLGGKKLLGRPVTLEFARPTTHSEPPKTPSTMTLSTMPADARILQMRYLAIGKQYDETDAQRPVLCLSCGQNHLQQDCPQKNCVECQNPIRDDGYPSLRRCGPCGQAYNDNLARSDDSGPCNLCNREGHNEHKCDLSWRTYLPPTGDIVPKVKALPMSCYSCGQDTHWGADCPTPAMDDDSENISRPTTFALETFSQANASHFIDSQSSHIAPSLLVASSSRPNILPPPPTHGKGPKQPRTSPKARGSRPIDLTMEDDNQDDAENFVRPSVAANRPTRSHIRFGTTRSDSSRQQPPPGLPVRPPFLQTVQQPPGHHPLPMNGVGGRGGHGNAGGVAAATERWAQQYNQAPLPHGPPPPGPTGIRGGARGGRVGLGRGGGNVGETGLYRPMPSAAAGAWRRHRM